MKTRADIVAEVVQRVRARFAARGEVAAAPSGELNTFLVRELQNTVRALDDPFGAVIKGWQGQAFQLDLCWWESEEHPEDIVLGLAGAILDYEVRRQLGLPT